MTPPSQSRPVRCSSLAAVRLPSGAASTTHGTGLGVSYGEEVRVYGGHPNTPEPLPSPTQKKTVSDVQEITQTTPNLKPPSNQRTIILEFDTTCVFRRKSKSTGFYLKLIRQPVQAPRPPHIILLAENDYPPVDRDEVYKEIFEQAENFKKYRST